MRVAMVVTGAALFTFGAGALALGLGGFDGLGGLSARPPLDPALVRLAGVHPWLLAAAAGVAELLSLAGQIWLVLQVRALLRQWWPDVDPRTRALAKAAEGELLRGARALPEVRETRARLTGTVTRPRLVLTVLCEGDAVLGEVYGELGAGPVERYRRAIGMPDLPVVIRCRLAFPPSGRRRPGMRTA